MTSTLLKLSKWSRIGLILGIIVALGVTNLGCVKETNENNNPVNEIPDEYYVRYIVKSSTGGYIVDRYANISTENNTTKNFTISNNSWEVTIGPVQKGFNASLSAGFAKSLARLSISAELHVSKNNAQFTLKGSDSGSSSTGKISVAIGYTIK